jgi:hypothetical protein
MVAMQVADKYVAYPGIFDLVFTQLHLGTFSTIYQVVILFNMKQL